jgi:hypothetical protein
VPELTLELIVHGEAQTQVLPLSAHVHKYTESFIYTDKIQDTSIPIAYYESDPLDSWKNVQLIDKTYSLSANTYGFVGTQPGWTEVNSMSFSSQYKEIAVTNVLGVDEFGRKKPLFWKHVLPENTVEVSLSIISAGNRVDVDTGFLKNVTENVIYTNYQNYFNPDTGAYRLYFVISVEADGTVSHELLNPQPAAKEATWEDIILTGPLAGELVTGYPVFTRERNSSGYTFQFNTVGPWYTKVIEASVIQPRMPTGRGPKDAWNLKFTNGDFSTYISGRLRRYWLPEYHLQPFSPSKPYIYSTYRSFMWVNRNTIVSTRPNLAINPGSQRHFELYIYDKDDVLLRVLTTKSEDDGVRWGNTNVFMEADHILSWDNHGGFISLGVEIDPNWNFYATYFYEADDFEYTLLTLNPLQNRKALACMWVYYIIPDADDDDQALHMLGVDKAGLIIYSSQKEGRSYSNLQILNDDGSYNPDTIIGKRYRSDITSTDTFVRKYSLEYDNDYAYYVLAEVVVLDLGVEEDSIVIDVRRPGAVIDEEYFEDAIRANPHILQSHLGLGKKGQEIPENAVMLVRAPITLLEEYGGVLSPDRAQRLLNTYLPAADHAVVEWDYPKSLLTGNSIEPGRITLYMTWEGPGLVYNIYKKKTLQQEWTTLATIQNPPEGTVSYVDIDVIQGETYFYGVSIAPGEVSTWEALAP